MIIPIMLVVNAMFFVCAAVTGVGSVHEQVHKQAAKHQQVGQSAIDMHRVLGQQVEPDNPQGYSCGKHHYPSQPATDSLLKLISHSSFLSSVSLEIRRQTLPRLLCQSVVYEIGRYAVIAQAG
jgi:hypothetical protein